jgi:hypothetical protein
MRGSSLFTRLIDGLMVMSVAERAVKSPRISCATKLLDLVNRSQYSDGMKEFIAHSLHAMATRHRKDIEASSLVGCFYCLRIFPSSDIHEWTDSGETAICPCGADAVLPGRLVDLFPSLLLRMNRFWFRSV